MKFSLAVRRTCVVLALSATFGVTFSAYADSFASSASSAGSASSGSVSDSLHGSSKSSTGNDKVADGDYHIIDIADAPERADFVRVALQGDGQQRIELDLPRAVLAKQRLDRGDTVHTQRRVYGYEFSRGDTREAFYLVIADDWYGELAARPLSL
ncbi:MAG: hypothetical protein ABIP34_17855 [Rhodoferax sp.]|uniref:hypothetical protein n=1 Tax=Rhodoferax sp. TaxID=50421 RepID=UPI003267FBAB